MSYQRILIGFVLLNAFVQSACLAPAQEPSWSAQNLEFFETKIRPILSQNCFDCHSAKADKLKGGLMLDSRSRILKGGETGPALVPHQPNESALIDAVRYESMEMPPKGKLDSGQIELLVQWVEMGAPWPAEPEPTRTAANKSFDLAARKVSHWCWQPVQIPIIPQIQKTEWPKQPLDHFVLAQLESHGLSPAAAADRRTLLRRLSFALHGLPPSQSRVESFLNNRTSTAIEDVVTDLLKSPAFGEHWGRHWLDLVRYAESRGHEFDADIPNAFQYRDYVIRALNQDIPYDQFVLEHIAGDLLEHPRRNSDSGFNESILGTGFWFLGEWTHSPVDIRKEETDRFDNMIDVFSKTFQGLTISCARCHDHKFDAISTRDYYALSGFLQGSHFRQVRFDTLLDEQKAALQLNALDRDFSKKLRSLLATAWSTHREAITQCVAKMEQPAEWLKTIESASRSPLLGPETNESSVVVNYRLETSSELSQDGVIFGTAVRRPGELFESVHPSTGARTPQFELHALVRNDPIWNDLISTSESPTNLRSKLDSIPRPGRTLLTPSFEIQHGNVSCLVRGSGHIVACVDSHRLVQGPLHGETIREFDVAGDGFQWIALDLTRYVGHRVHIEFTPKEKRSMELMGVRDNKLATAEVQYPISSKDSPSWTELFETSMDRLQEDPDATWLPTTSIAVWNWVLQNRLQWIDAESPTAIGLDRAIANWIEQRDSIRNHVPKASRTAPAMIDGTGEDDRVLIRGNSASPGDVVPRRFLECLDGGAALCRGSESGRLQLANRLNASSNPLTSRVLVNRVWHHLLGQGIVPTVDDFGALGQPPSHPELLDHLVHQFEQNGKSLKHLIRIITSSQTYQMASHPTKEGLALDPKNRWHHYVAPKRLSGESIRDSLLFLSGQLDSRIHGEPVPIHLTEFMDGRGKPPTNGPLNGNNRRSIYVAVRRNFLSPFLLTFDTPNPFSSMGRRNQSNVPAQALIMMNDPLVVEQSKAWAQRILDERLASSRERIDTMYQMAFARPANEQELLKAQEYIAEQSRSRAISQDDVSLWSELAHAMVNLKEFIYIR